MSNNGLPVSASKADVMARLGLTGANGEQIYRLMLVSCERKTQDLLLTISEE